MDPMNECDWMEHGMVRRLRRNARGSRNKEASFLCNRIGNCLLNLDRDEGPRVAPQAQVATVLTPERMSIG